MPESFASSSCAGVEVACVVLNYRSSQETVRCVKALQKSNCQRLKVIVVDNHSGDDSLDTFRQQLAGVELLAHDRNDGYGDGNNVGLAHAARLGAKYAWVVTPDVEVDADCLGKLCEAMEGNPRLGICGPLVQAGDCLITGTFVEKERGFFPYHRTLTLQCPTDELEREAEVDFVDGCAIFLRISMLEQIGLFRREFFMYFEDTELCLRAKDSGWEVALISLARVVTRGISEDRNGRSYFMIRNCVFLARLRGQFLRQAIQRHVYAALSFGLGFHGDRPRGVVWQTLRAIKDGLRLSYRDLPVLDDYSRGELEHVSDSGT